MCYPMAPGEGRKAPMTRARIPTAAAMMIATEARFRPVKVLLNRVVRVVLPCDPKSMSFAMAWSSPAKIKVTKMTVTRAAIAITSPILNFRRSPEFSSSGKSYLSI